MANAAFTLCMDNFIRRTFIHVRYGTLNEDTQLLHNAIRTHLLHHNRQSTRSLHLKESLEARLAHHNDTLWYPMIRDKLIPPLSQAQHTSQVSDSKQSYIIATVHESYMTIASARDLLTDYSIEN